MVSKKDWLSKAAASEFNEDFAYTNDVIADIQYKSLHKKEDEGTTLLYYGRPDYVKPPLSEIWIPARLAKKKPNLDNRTLDELNDKPVFKVLSERQSQCLPFCVRNVLKKYGLYEMVIKQNPLYVEDDPNCNEKAQNSSIENNGKSEVPAQPSQKGSNHSSMRSLANDEELNAEPKVFTQSVYKDNSITHFIQMDDNDVSQKAAKQKKGNNVVKYQQKQKSNHFSAENLANSEKLITEHEVASQVVYEGDSIEYHKQMDNNNIPQKADEQNKGNEVVKHQQIQKNSNNSSMENLANEELITEPEITVQPVYEGIPIVYRKQVDDDNVLQKATKEKKGRKTGKHQQKLQKTICFEESYDPLNDIAPYTSRKKYSLNIPSTRHKTYADDFSNDVLKDPFLNEFNEFASSQLYAEDNKQSIIDLDDFPDLTYSKPFVQNGKSEVEHSGTLWDIENSSQGSIQLNDGIIVIENIPHSVPEEELNDFLEVTCGKVNILKKFEKNNQVSIHLKTEHDSSWIVECMHNQLPFGTSSMEPLNCYVIEKES